MSRPAASMLTASVCPETGLLLACARTSIGLETAGRISAILQEGIDWPSLIQAARQHRMMPLLYWGLHTTCPEAVPQDILDLLQDHFHAAARHNLFLTGELLKLVNLFQAHGIPAIPFKGPVLAATIYGDLPLREFDDLDILIHRRDFLTARNLLISQGYRPRLDLNDAQVATHLQSHHDYVFVRDDGRVVVDLQWGIIQIPFAFPHDFECLWERLEPVLLAGKPVLNLPAQDLLVVLCAHGSKHLWERLIWICDIAALIHTHQGMDWGRVVERASALGGERMLTLGLLLANDLLGAAPPKEVLDRIQANAPVVVTLAEQLRAGLLHLGGMPPGIVDDTPFFYLRMLDRFCDRVRLCLRLYPSLLHPIRLMRKYRLSPLKDLLGF